MTLADHPQDFASKHDDLGPRIADTNAEMTLLSAVVLQPAIAGQVFAVAPPEAFHDPRHIVIASLLAEMAKAGDTWDPARLVTELMSRGNDVRTLAPYLHTIVSVAAAPAMASYHAKTVRQMWIRREIVGASQKILHRAGDPSWDLTELGAHLATAADRYMDLYAGGQAVKPPPLLVDFIEGEDSWDWVVPGFLERQDRLMITGHEGLGKALDVLTPVPTPSGWTTMGELAAGDVVFSPDGTPVPVHAVTEVMTGRPCYRVSFSDGAQVVADAGHWWRVGGFAHPTTLSTARIATLLSLPDPPQILVQATFGRSEPGRRIVAASPVPSVPVRCIEVANEDGMFVVGREYIPTHNSHLTRMFGTCAAAGVHPFTGSLVPPVDVLIVDCENPERLLRRRTRPIVGAVEVVSGRSRWEWAPLRLERIPQGLDLADAKDAARLDALVASCSPQLLVIGPMYRLIRADLKEENPARELVAVLDDIRVRHNIALIIEAHSPKNTRHGGGRTVEPYGASLFLRWPEFGYGLARSADDEEPNRAPRIVDLPSWRGDREERYWPGQLMRGNTDNGELPWIPYGDPAALAEVFGNPFVTTPYRRSA